jgi:hypothetical protein
VTFSALPWLATEALRAGEPWAENPPARAAGSAGLTGPPHRFGGTGTDRRIEPVTNGKERL